MDKLISQLTENKVFSAAMALLALYILYVVRDIITLLIIAFILVIALRPAVVRLRKLKFPNWLASIGTIIITISILGGLFYLIYEGISGQIGAFEATLRDAIGLLPFVDPNTVQNLSLQNVAEQLTNTQNQILRSLTSTAVNFVTGFLAVLVLSAYWLTDYETVRDFLTSQFKNKQKARQTYDKIEKKFGGWVRAQLMISLIIGTLSYIIYQVIGLPAALSLAVIAGFLEVIPTLGPILAAVPAVLIAFTVSPQLAVITLIANVVLQQLENQLIAPKILQKSVKLHPIAVIVVLFAGNQLGGLMGVFLAVPVTLLALTIFRSYTNQPI